MEHSIRSLRTGLEDDRVQNPLLYEFNIDQYHPIRDQNKITEARKILEEEVVFTSDPTDPVEKLKRSMIEVVLSTIFHLNPLLCETIFTRLTNSGTSTDVIETIYTVFIKDLGEFIIDNEFGRLSSVGTRGYYKSFIKDIRSQPFKKSINKQVASFVGRVKDPSKSNIIYVGDKLGEQPSPGRVKNLYVDLGIKTGSQLVNLAIAKLKIENDFVSYKLIMAIQVLLDYGVISNDTYNEITYGTKDENKINLIRLGLNLSILSKIESDEQLNNLSINGANQIIASPAFIEYKKTLDDLTRYEIDKIL